MIEELEKTNKIDEACNRYKKVFISKHPKFNKLDNWLEKESIIFDSEIKNSKNPKYYKYQQGQILKIDFGVNIGTELSHTHFAIVLNDDDNIKADNITVIPITSKKGYKRIPLGYILNNLYSNSSKYSTNKSYAMLTQIKTISKKRVLPNSKIYVCDKIILNKLNKAIKSYFNLYRN